MKQGLNLQPRKQLTLTPQLQQAIHLLQLSALELEDELIQRAAENPLLDYSDLRTMPEAFPVRQFVNDGFEPIEHLHAKETLFDVLSLQLIGLDLDVTEACVAEIILDSIDDKGYLLSQLIDIQALTQSYLGYEVGLNIVESVLHAVQRTVIPTGIAARSLQECLLLQLSEQQVSARVEYAIELVERHFEALAHEDYAYLQQLEGAQELLVPSMHLIRSLNARPAASLVISQDAYVIPDAVIFKEHGRWHVNLHYNPLKSIACNTAYNSLIKSAKHHILQSYTQQGIWLIKSLEKRNETLLKVCRAIVKRQYQFLEHGPLALKAMTLQDIADEIDMHVSTVSRITSSKYLDTPRGLFALKYFFSNNLSDGQGSSHSSKAITELIKQVIYDESHEKPLSDSKIGQLLQGQGISIVRRTVSKYREQLNIPKASIRKQRYKVASI